MDTAALTIAFVIAATLGCTAHEDPRETDAEPQLQLIESSKQRIAAGDIEVAVADLIRASEIASTLPSGSEKFCMFGDSVIEIGDQLFEANHHPQSALAYAIAVRFAQDCPELDREDLRQRRANAQAAAAGFSPLRPPQLEPRAAASLPFARSASEADRHVVFGRTW